MTSRNFKFRKRYSRRILINFLEYIHIRSYTCFYGIGIDNGIDDVHYNNNESRSYWRRNRVNKLHGLKYSLWQRQFNSDVVIGRIQFIIQTCNTNILSLKKRVVIQVKLNLSLIDIAIHMFYTIFKEYHYTKNVVPSFILYVIFHNITGLLFKIILFTRTMLLIVWWLPLWHKLNPLTDILIYFKC